MAKIMNKKQFEKFSELLECKEGCNFRECFKSTRIVGVRDSKHKRSGGKK